MRDQARTAVRAVQDEDRESIAANVNLSEEQRVAMLNDIEHNAKLFQSVFVEAEHNVYAFICVCRACGF